MLIKFQLRSNIEIKVTVKVPKVKGETARWWYIQQAGNLLAQVVKDATQWDVII